MEINNPLYDTSKQEIKKSGVAGALIGFVAGLKVFQDDSSRWKTGLKSLVLAAIAAFSADKLSDFMSKGEEDKNPTSDNTNHPSLSKSEGATFILDSENKLITEKDWVRTNALLIRVDKEGKVTGTAVTNETGYFDRDSNGETIITNVSNKNIRLPIKDGKINLGEESTENLNGFRIIATEVMEERKAQRHKMLDQSTQQIEITPNPTTSIASQNSLPNQPPLPTTNTIG